MKLFLFLFFGLVISVGAEEIKLANGTIVQGDVVQAKDEGLAIKTAEGEKTLAWKTLSAGTRFRYQPSYRANFDHILKGDPASMRTNAAISSP